MIKKKKTLKENQKFCQNLIVKRSFFCFLVFVLRDVDLLLHLTLTREEKKVVIYLPEGPELQPAFLMARAAFGGEFCTGKPRGNAKALDYTTSSQWGHWRDCRKRWVFSERSKLGLKRKTALHLGAGERLFSSNPPPNVADIWGAQWLPRSGIWPTCTWNASRPPPEPPWASVDIEWWQPHLPRGPVCLRFCSSFP